MVDYSLRHNAIGNNQVNFLHCLRCVRPSAFSLVPGYLLVT